MDWIQTLQYVLRLGKSQIQIRPCLNLDVGVGENIVHYLLVLAKCWIQIPPPPCLNLDLHIHTDIHCGDITKRACIEQAHAARLKIFTFLPQIGQCQAGQVVASPLRHASSRFNQVEDQGSHNECSIVRFFGCAAESGATSLSP